MVWPILGAIAKAASVAGKVGKVAGAIGKVGKLAKVAGKAGQVAAKVGKVAGGTALKGAKVAGKGAIKGGKAAGRFGKGAAKEFTGLGGKKGAASTTTKTAAKEGAKKISGAEAWGGKTARGAEIMAAMGGGGAQPAPPAQASEEQAPQGRPQTLWTKNIEGNPSHYGTHQKKKGKPKAGKKQVKHNKRQLKTTPVKTTSGKQKPKAKKIDPEKVPSKEKKGTRITKPLLPEKEQFNVDPSLIQNLTSGGGLATGGQGPFMEGGQQGGELPPSRDVEEPAWSKILSGTTRVLTAGAPAPIRGVVEDVLPSSRYRAEQQKVEEGRDFIWKNVVDKVDTPSEIDSFVQNPAYVDAVVSRIPELSNKKDVESFLHFANREGLKVSELLGEGNWSATPTPGSIEAQVEGQPVYITPEKPEKYIKLGTGERLVNAETGEVVTKASKRQEKADFFSAYKQAKPGRTELDAHLAFAGLQSGRFMTSVVGNSLVRTDKYTGEQTTITAAKLKNSNIEKEVIRDRFGKPIGIVFYDLDEIDEEKGPKVYDPIMFKDITTKTGEPIVDPETGEVKRGFLPKIIEDMLLGVIGLERSQVSQIGTGETKKSKAVNKWLEGGQ
jgi:hypothetical protein